MSVVKMYLITNCICIFFAFLNVIGNGIVIYLFQTGRLDSKRNLRLIMFMAITDILFSFLILPEIIFMISLWEPEQVDYDPIIMAITGWPLPMFLKVSVGLHVGAASERILALYFPLIYRNVDHVQCSNILLIISFLFGSLDTFLTIFSFRFEPRVNCSSIGCFVNSTFRTYWGTSNMTCGILIIIMSIFVFFKVQKLGKGSGWIGNTPAERRMAMATSQKFRQANKTTCGVLLSCLFCLTIPSLLISLIETITGFSVFEKIGPFYVAALLSSGVMNCLIFLILNGSVKSKVSKNASDIITAVASSKPSKQTIFIDLN